MMRLSVYSLIATLVALFFASPSVAGSGFSLSCPYSFLSESFLTSTCWRSNGQELTTELDLNNCIGNHDGQLVWSGGYIGNYAKSCFSCALDLDEAGDSFTLNCQCLDVGWKSQTTSLRLSDHIGNSDGVQECFGHLGSTDVDTTYRRKLR